MRSGGEGGWRSLAVHLVAVVGLALATNGLIFGLGWAVPSGDAPTSRLAPPGWVVGAAWTVLFALLAFARWRLDRPATATARGWVTALIASCLAYPFYALAPGSRAAAWAGNLATIALAAYVDRRVWPADRPAAACVAPIVPWVAFATATILAGWG